MSPAAVPIVGPAGFAEILPVAAGGTSQVFRARQVALGRVVAVKLFTVGEGDRAHAEREVRAAGLLGAHLHVVTIHEYGTSPSGHPYVVTPWYHRGSLADELRWGGPMPVPVALRVGVKLASALCHLHAHGVVHGDVKPANVLFTALSEPVLADLSLS